MSVSLLLVSLLRLTVVRCSSNSNKKEFSKYAKARVKFNICCWNVRTLLYHSSSNRPERRTALVTKELQRLNNDIAALSETRLSDEDHFVDVGTGYTLFWVGNPKGMRRDGGVGFPIRTSLMDQIERPARINDHIMKVRIPLSCRRYLSIISVYVPTLQASEDTLNSFYGALCSAVTSIPREENLILLGDFNARVGREHTTWEALGHHGIGKMNSNGLRLLELCSECNLVICNTFFHHKLKHKTTWTHPRSKHGHMIDFIITRTDDLGDVSTVRVLRSAECDTDHGLLRGKFKLRIQKRHRMGVVGAPKRINVAKLAQPGLSEDLREKLDSLVFDDSWESFREQVYNTGVQILGFRMKRHRDWFDENCSVVNDLLKAQRALREALLNNCHQHTSDVEKKYKEHKALLQRELRKIKNKWWNNISSEIQKAFDANNTKCLYTLLNTAFGPKSSLVAPLKSKDNTTLIKDPQKILLRWKEHFADLFDNLSEIDMSIIDSLPQRQIIYRLERSSSLEEVRIAIKQVSSGKAPGVDGIPVELLKVGSENVEQAVFRLITISWTGSTVPQDWVDGIIITLFKGKAGRDICDHYRGITLLETVGKVLGRVLLNRLMEDICPSILPESQSGFRTGRGTTDMIFSARQIQEKCLEQQVPLYQVFVDLTKAFDTVNRDALWIILGRIGCPPVFVNMFKKLHSNMKARISFNGHLSDTFQVDNGVKQGDIPAPTLFSIFFAVMLSHAFQDCNRGILLHFRTTGKVFNLRRFNARSKTFDILVRELLYADDANFLAHSEEDMQHILDRFSAASAAFGLKINLEKTTVMFTHAPGYPYIAPSLTVYGKILNVVDNFVYLGSALSRDGTLDAEICLRIHKASVAFGRLEKRVWADRGITSKTKVSIYKACVLSTLLYSSETWTVLQKHVKWLERFHQKCLRRILNIKWHTQVPDSEILKQARCDSIAIWLVSI